MRPVNLIPPEERRGGRRPARTGPLAYLLVGGLVAALAGVTAVVLTGNAIAEREAEVARLQQEEQIATARAESLRAFADFAAMEEARIETVSSLARSRFDWERVLHELALVIPEDIQLTGLTGTVSADSSLENQAESEITAELSSPSLTMAGCGTNHASVAGLVAALEDIDGVTRVGLGASELSSGPDEASTGGTGGSCSAGRPIAQFDIVVAFDGVEAGPSSVASASSSTATSAAQQVGESAQAVTSAQGG